MDFSGTNRTTPCPSILLGYQSTTDWTCRCPVCQKLFEADYGYPMPKVLTDQVKKWARRRKANETLQGASRIVKSIRPDWSVTQCSLPAENNFYMSFERGYDDWEQIRGHAGIRHLFHLDCRQL